MPKVLNDWSVHGYSEDEWKSFTRHKRFYIRHPERVKSSSKAWIDRNKEYNSSRQRVYQLKNKYGITEEDYQLMFDNQGGKCAICLSVKQSGKWQRHGVDHCHTTGVVRALLCNACNRGIGLLKDNPELLRSAANYIEHYKLITKGENEQRKNISGE